MPVKVITAVSWTITNYLSVHKAHRRDVKACVILSDVNACAILSLSLKLIYFMPLAVSEWRTLDNRSEQQKGTSLSRYLKDHQLPVALEGVRWSQTYWS